MKTIEQLIIEAEDALIHLLDEIFDLDENLYNLGHFKPIIEKNNLYIDAILIWMDEIELPEGP